MTRFLDLSRVNKRNIEEVDEDEVLGDDLEGPILYNVPVWTWLLDFHLRLMMGMSTRLLCNLKPLLLISTCLPPLAPARAVPFPSLSGDAAELPSPQEHPDIGMPVPSQPAGDDDGQA